MNNLEYPRPDFVRKDWKSLNGDWDFKFEKGNWRKIKVPYVFQCNASGIGEDRLCDNVTYKRSFSIPEGWKDKRILLHFGAVDYHADVYVNGCHVGSHDGGSSPFYFDITSFLTCEDEQALTVEVWDPCESETIPRGKQCWTKKPYSIWYTRSTGIWQTVWIEPVSDTYISQIHFTPDIDRGNVDVNYKLTGKTENTSLDYEILFNGAIVFCGSVSALETSGVFSVNLFHEKIFRTSTHGNGWCWSPEHPNLFDVKFSLIQDGKLIDSVDSYFGMRKIETRNGKIFLNNRPYYMKLVLDQGYWPESLMTAPSDDALRKDIEMSKQMGFNGCRKHQKCEDPRFLYWADKLGYLIWGEVPSFPSFSTEAADRYMGEWSAIIRRDYNHPSIIAWVAINESWGLPNIMSNKMQQSYSLALYYYLKSIDQTRLVVSNDGWEMTYTDICAIHNYQHGTQDDMQQHDTFSKSLRTVDNLINSMTGGHSIYADGFTYRGEPIILTEFGGIAFPNGEGGWGYTTIIDEADFINEYNRLLKAIDDSEALFGFCYTQLTDVEQEQNGLLTFDRKFKVDPKNIAEINNRIGRKHML